MPVTALRETALARPAQTSAQLCALAALGAVLALAFGVYEGASPAES